MSVIAPLALTVRAESGDWLQPSDFTAVAGPGPAL